MSEPTLLQLKRLEMLGRLRSARQEYDDARINPYATPQLLKRLYSAVKSAESAYIAAMKEPKP